MLVLTRRPNQVIHIHTSDGLIEVHLNDCNTYQARLGIVAPTNVKILREELDELEGNAQHPSRSEKPAALQRNTTPSLLRALFTRGSTERQ
jgi:carbon storage regulator CsrA